MDVVDESKGGSSKEWNASSVKSGQQVILTAVSCIAHSVMLQSNNILLLRSSTDNDKCPYGLTQYAAGLNGCLCMAMGSVLRVGQAIWVEIMSTYALRLISRTGKRFQHCPV